MRTKDLYGNPTGQPTAIDFERDLLAMQQDFETYFNQKISEHSQEAKQLLAQATLQRQPEDA